MDRKTVQNTLIFQEMGEEKRKEWFSSTRAKFISHVDTFYYSVKTVGDWSMHIGVRSLVNTLKALKEEAKKAREPQPFMEHDVFDDLTVNYYGFYMYGYCISKTDCFDIFVAESVPNQDTNGILVQLRSQFIWLNGLQSAFYQSLVYLYGLLERYGLEASGITENRLDIAWHTNYIQDMLSFFKDESLGQMQISSFKRWSKEGNFLGDELYNDYISLGRRKSNSAFVRIYNKSKEVIEMGYKQFFVPIWRESGLISAFDQYIFDQVFERGKQSWNYKEVARCLFYLEYGQDEDIKGDIRQLLCFDDTDTRDYKRLADKCVPDLTDVVNIEIQTKRDYTRNFVLPDIQYPDWVPVCERRVYKVMYMLQSIQDFITYDTIRFVKYKGEYAKIRRERRPTADWWLRLSACGELDGIHYDLCREYQRRFDVQRCKSRSLTSIAALASLIEREQYDDFTLWEDWQNIVGALNDNDLTRYSRVRLRKQRELGSRLERMRQKAAGPEIETEGDGFVEQTGQFTVFE